MSAPANHLAGTTESQPIHWTQLSSGPALSEFETALKQTPNRFHTLLGIARAAKRAGNRAKASEYYGKLVELAKNADTERQEIREAKEYLAQKG
jgi:tetratricopeptide (TPR) repeat protein